ncbi:hypothetical protein FisN_1Hh173 [Fistulifera solaris]|uniref:Uncharacterized protein n=1 Tax=Fistulifera solaris TaxID=1519565 RepID=A0A1Z5JE17_FISSO|nr:hypothetical protein FisN_1Hh173 [Fistulifera solaris]|eukprot:GAX12243.1 hypothetical protein FisN_1Hh173 [Fistulifera solaris]
MTLWFLSSKSDYQNRANPPLKDIVKLLYPNKSASQPQKSDNRTRFSHLLLEHGEKSIQDWAVVAKSSPVSLSSLQSPSSGPTHSIHWAQSTTNDAPKKQSSRRKKQQDTSKDASPTAHMNAWPGRLHLCSRSLVFEPNSTAYPIVRCPFNKLQEKPAGRDKVVEWIAKKHIAIHSVIAPFQAVNHAVHFRIEFSHSSVDTLLQHTGELYEICQKQSHHQLAQLEATSLKTPPVMDPTMLHVREQLVTSPVPCQWMTPLQSTDGVLLVTNERFTFQSASGTSSFWYLDQVAATARRYCGLRDCALEVYWQNGTSTLLALERRHEREQVLRHLHQVPCVTNREFVLQVLKAWQMKEISNFEYLLALNSAAGRTFHDLSRYPVFPWVLRDFTSSKLDLTNPSVYRDMTKPVGALNEERLEYFRNRMLGMHDMGEDFLYGTHYSAPGYVLYYLVRSMPEHMLCLQNGKFDAPDRMFHSIEQCFQCVLTNHADVKELIPEFYSQDFDFLINARGLQLGATQNGDHVNDVQLPTWARSARDFLRKHREALESDICTKMLPKWIDLIFGYKSRGEAAKEASNLFHHTAYLGPHDLAAMQSAKDRFQAELQATEFGIVPDMLFIGPHPAQIDKFSEDCVSQDIGRTTSREDSSREAWELLDPPSSHDDIHTDAVPGLVVESPEQEEIESTLSMDQNDVFGVSNENLETLGSSERAREVQVSTPTMDASKVQKTSPPNPTASDANGAISKWDMQILERRQLHNDSVSGCALLLGTLENSKSVLVTTSLDGGLKVHSMLLETASMDPKDLIASTLSRFTMINRKQTPLSSGSSKLVEYRNHSTRDPLASLVLALDGTGGAVAFAGGHDDVVLAYGINSACAVASVYSHRDAVTGLDLIARSPFDSGNALWLENATHILISGSWDATVKVWSVAVSGGETVAVNREPLAELFDAASSIVCVAAISIPTGGILASAGCADGSFCVWNIHSDGVQVVIHNEPAKRGSGPCSVVKWVSSGGALHMFAAFSTGKVAAYSLVEGVRLERRNAVSVGVPILSLAYADGFILVGCADGGLRLIPLRQGCYFEAKPTLWPAVNNKSSPAISNISLSYTIPANKDDEVRCVCCTGGADGSVALFELRKA